MKKKLRHRLAFAVLRPIARCHLLLRYGYRAKKFKSKIKPPYLILSNHVGFLDPFMVAISFRLPIYYLANDNLSRWRIAGRLVNYFLSPIPTSRAGIDVAAIRELVHISKQGGTVGIFPSGEPTMTGEEAIIYPQIAKLVKLLKLPLLLYNLSGVYGVDPRWRNKRRRGKSFGSVVRVVPYDEYKDMPNEELYELIRDALSSVKMIPPYRGRKRAEYLERMLFWCPDCGKFSTLESSGTEIRCKACGYLAEYGVDLKFHLKQGHCEISERKEWYAAQLQALSGALRGGGLSGIGIFSDRGVKLREEKGRSWKTLCKRSELSVRSDRLCVAGKDEKTWKFPFSEITSIRVYNRNKINFYAEGKAYAVTGGKRMNALKYMAVYYLTKDCSEEERHLLQL